MFNCQQSLYPELCVKAPKPHQEMSGLQKIRNDKLLILYSMFPQMSKAKLREEAVEILDDEQKFSSYVNKKLEEVKLKPLSESEDEDEDEEEREEEDLRNQIDKLNSVFKLQQSNESNPNDFHSEAELYRNGSLCLDTAPSGTLSVKSERSTTVNDLSLVDTKSNGASNLEWNLDIQQDNLENYEAKSSSDNDESCYERKPKVCIKNLKCFNDIKKNDIIVDSKQSQKLLLNYEKQGAIPKGFKNKCIISPNADESQPEKQVNLKMTYKNCKSSNVLNDTVESKTLNTTNNRYSKTLNGLHGNKTTRRGPNGKKPNVKNCTPDFSKAFFYHVPQAGEPEFNIPPGDYYIIPQAAFVADTNFKNNNYDNDNNSRNSPRGKRCPRRERNPRANSSSSKGETDSNMNSSYEQSTNKTPDKMGKKRSSTTPNQASLESTDESKKVKGNRLLLASTLRNLLTSPKPSQNVNVFEFLELLKEKDAKASKTDEQKIAKINESQEQYNFLLRELPNHDPQFLEKVLNETKGNEIKLELFLKSEKTKEGKLKVYEKLLKAFPHEDKNYLEKKAEDLALSTEVELEQFIKTEAYHQKLSTQYKKLVAAFPSEDVTVLMHRCQEYEGNEELVDEYIALKTAEARKAEETTNRAVDMYQILPDADPVFLQQKLDEFEGNLDGFNNYLSELLDRKDYPKVKEPTPEDKHRTQLWWRFVDNFQVEDFLRKYPDPEDEFENTTVPQIENADLMLRFLKNRYPQVDGAYLDENYKTLKKVLKVCEKLDLAHNFKPEIDPSFKTEPISENLLLLLVYITNRIEIKHYLARKAERREEELNEARIRNFFLTCPCCFDEQCIVSDIVSCPDGHILCKPCVKKYVETKMGDGVYKFNCLSAGCRTEFQIKTLEESLPEAIFLKIFEMKQHEEIEEAGVAGLEHCKACFYAYIPDPEAKIFVCENPDCGKETCRLCGEDSHVPLRCEEIERPKDLQVRKDIEEKMTQALVRSCPTCGKKFIKEDGCNKVACSCGTLCCYICQKKVNDYSHFNGNGGSNYHLCPLYSNNDDLHIRDVRNAGIRAKDEAKIQNPDVHLVHDPTKDNVLYFNRN